MDSRRPCASPTLADTTETRKKLRHNFQPSEDLHHHGVCFREISSTTWCRTNGCPCMASDFKRLEPVHAAFLERGIRNFKHADSSNKSSPEQASHPMHRFRQLRLARSSSLISSNNCFKTSSPKRRQQIRVKPDAKFNNLKAIMQSFFVLTLGQVLLLSQIGALATPPSR